MDEKEKAHALNETIEVFHKVLSKYKDDEEIEESLKRIERLKEKRNLK